MSSYHEQPDEVYAAAPAALPSDFKFNDSQPPQTPTIKSRAGGSSKAATRAGTCSRPLS
jgi:hypothetical protein